MNRIVRTAVGYAIVLTLAANTLQAQFVVHDPVNYAQALARYAQLIEQLRFMVRQARRLPVDMATCYRVPTIRWRHHDVEGDYVYARPLLTALNFGDTSGALLQQVSEPLEDLEPVLSMVPPELQRRLANSYGSIQFADSIARMAVHHVGSVRSNGKTAIAAIENMEADAASGDDAFHSEAALLNKINTASVLGLRISETANQFLMHTREQLLLQNRRTRNAEAQLLDAELNQRRYGTLYGRDLMSQTAARLDGWRQP